MFEADNSKRLTDAETSQLAQPMRRVTPRNGEGGGGRGSCSDCKTVGFADFRWIKLLEFQ
ncbi:MAG: hypothetical protein ACKESB_03345 [Candidatus Hodgkinia cicadicola]